MNGQEEARGKFSTLVSDKRDEEKLRAYESLVRGGDERMARVARLGLAVSRVVAGDAPPSGLNAVFDDAMSLPKSSFWNGFMEAAAQALAKKGLGMDVGEPRRQMLAASLKAFSIAMGGCLPLSDFSMEVVREVKGAESSLAGDADSITMLNRSYSPGHSRLREERELAAGRKEKKRIAGS